jgi:hypothetical protein
MSLYTKEGVGVNSRWRKNWKREKPKTRFMREPRTEASRIGEKRPPFAKPRKG